MDGPLLCKDDQTESSTALADSQTGYFDLSLLDSPNENPMCASKTGTESLSNPSDASAEPLSYASKALSRDNSTDPSCNVPQCRSLYSEPAREDDDFGVHGCFDLSLPHLPHLSQDPISPTFESLPEICTKCEPELYFPLIQNQSTSQPCGMMSSLSQGLMTELLFNHSFSSERDQTTSLIWPATPQSPSLEGNTAIAPASDLYIFESDTQDFILSPSVAPQEIKYCEYQPLSQTGEKEPGDDSCKNVSMCDSADVEPRYRHYESDMIQHTGLRPPAMDACDVSPMLVSDVRQGKAEVTGLSPQPWRGDSPTEMWQDACQYLAGEDIKDQDVLDRRGHSMMQGGLSATSDLAFLPGKTQGSGYNPEVGDWFGWSSEKTRGPPFERWSSVDSWKSALSDWTEILTAPQEDITAAFTEIGAEIEALTQALAEVDSPVDPETSKEIQNTQLETPMVVQDQPPEVHDVPQSSVLSEQSCPPLRFETAKAECKGGESSQTAESLCVTPASVQGKKGAEEIQSSQAESSVRPTQKHSHMGSSDAMSASCRDVDLAAATLTCGSTSSANLGIPPFGGYVESLDAHIFIADEEDPIILNITEDTDLDDQNPPAEILNTKPLGDGLCEVTDGHSVSQQCFLTNQEAQRSCGPVDVYAERSDLLFQTSDSLTNANVSIVDRKPTLNINVSDDSAIPDLDGACLVEPLSGSPEFVTPTAPLSVGSPLICQTTSDLEGDQLCPQRSLNDNRDLSWDRVQPCVLGPPSDGITRKTSLEGDEELLCEKKNAVEPPERQCEHSGIGSSPLNAKPKIIIEDIHELSKELSNLVSVPADHFVISEEKHIAFFTLELNDPFGFWAPKRITTHQRFEVNQETDEEMPHKTHKNTSESKARSKKDKLGGHHHGPQVSKKQEPPHVSAQHACNKQDAHAHSKENHTSENAPAGLEDKEAKSVCETDVAAEAAQSKQHAKKKKKHGQNPAAVRSAPLADVESAAKPKSAKGRIEMFEAQLGAKAGKAEKDSDQSHVTESKSQQPEDFQGQQTPTDHKDSQPKSCNSSLKDDVVKRRRLSGDKFGKIVKVLESNATKADVSVKASVDEPKPDAVATRRKAYSEVVKQKIPPKEDLKVVKPIQAASVSGDPQSLCLWCQFACVFSDHTVTWSREGAVLSEVKRSAGDESRVSLTVSEASHKHLGKYQCHLSSLHGSLTLDYVLTYEVLSEIVIPPSPKTVASDLVQVGSEEEDVRCSSLMFKEDFLSDQYFGENRPLCIVTERIHFGEGMHRRAFRTKLQAGQIPLLVPGHSCVLKVHNSISYGTKNNDELVQKNFSLAVEECQVQNTAREYIKAYTAVARSVEAFGDVPEIIPIYLVHRPSNDIPYATLEEELIGDFVKYSVKDGKEINLMRRDSEAGQKCCAFQHWVYQTTEGNLLVTDMQGVGMRLTDVGIATCKKGYKGFKGNCATSFIDQFKALHQCNRYCEILELKSLQPKPKKPASAPKPKAQPSVAPKKKTFGPPVKGKT